MPAFVQQPAPSFSGTSVDCGEFKDVSLKDYLGKWLILLFYPMDFTFVCPTEILAYDRAIPDFAEINTSLLAVSTDSEYSHLAWWNLARIKGGLGPEVKLPLFADRNMKMSREYGVLIEDRGIALRGLFIIDPQGILRQSTINDLPIGRSVDETLRLVKALQFTDKHGEVCPANWFEGRSTIKPDPKGSLEYFASANGEANGNGATNGAKKRGLENGNGVEDGNKKSKH